MTLLEWAAGLLLAWATLRDVFDTAVVPGEARGPLKLARRLLFASLPIFRRTKTGIGTGFGPGVLVAAFVGWMVLLVLAFGLMAHAASGAFDPPLQGFPHALYVAGAAMTTMGFGTTEPSGVAAVLTVAASFCGLAVMTLAVTYLLEVEANIAVRDEGVLKLTTSAGEPPSALALLERYAGLGAHGEVQQELREGRQWCAAVLQSHATHPSLVYFRSARVGAGWPAVLGTLVDLALACEWLLDEPDTQAQAVLAREEALRLAREVVQLLGLEVVVNPVPPAAVQAFAERLARAGYAMRPERDLEGFAHARDARTACVDALAKHLGVPPAPLLPSS